MPDMVPGTLDAQIAAATETATDARHESGITLRVVLLDPAVLSRWAQMAAALRERNDQLQAEATALQDAATTLRCRAAQYAAALLAGRAEHLPQCAATIDALIDGDAAGDTRCDRCRRLDELLALEYLP